MVCLFYFKFKQFHYGNSKSHVYATRAEAEEDSYFQLGARQYFLGLIVTSQPVDLAFSENQTKLGVLVLSVSLQMLSDYNSILDEIFRQVRGQVLGLEDPRDLVASYETYLGHTMGVPQNCAYLRGRQDLFGHVEDLLFEIIRCELQPSWNTAPVRQGCLEQALSGRVHVTHDGSRGREQDP